MGVTRLRLARFGCRNRPFYRIVAIDSRKFREAKPLEYLGTYNPLPYELDGAKEVRLVVDRVKYWLSVGAQPSDRVAYLLWRAGLGPAPPVRLAPTRSKPKEKKGFHSASDAWNPSAPSLGAAFRMTPPARVAFHGFFSRVVEMR